VPLLGVHCGWIVGRHAFEHLAPQQYLRIGGRVGLVDIAVAEDILDPVENGIVL
jgi:hypothetical protein